VILKELVADSSVEVRLAAVKGLGALGESEAIPLLVIASQDNAMQVALGAIRGLDSLKSEELLNAYKSLYKRADTETRVALVPFLAQFPLEEARGFLLVVLKQNDMQMNLAVARNLNDMEVDLALEIAAITASDKNMLVRQETALFLSIHLPRKEALDTLRKLAEDSDETVSKISRQFLENAKIQ